MRYLTPLDHLDGKERGCFCLVPTFDENRVAVKRETKVQRMVGAEFVLAGSF
jgi:hypothetical protein